MGFLLVFGDPLDWEESKQYFEIIRNDALKKIIDWVLSTKEKKCCPKLGYEVLFLLS